MASWKYEAPGDAQTAGSLTGGRISVPDPAKQLQAIYLAGFEIETFDRFPNTVGLPKGNCIALVQPTADGLKLIGQPGWHMGEILGVLVERSGQNGLPGQERTGGGHPGAPGGAGELPARAGRSDVASRVTAPSGGA